MTLERARSEAARSMRIAESLVESLAAALVEVESAEIRAAYESAQTTLLLVQRAAEELGWE